MYPKCTLNIDIIVFQSFRVVGSWSPSQLRVQGGAHPGQNISITGHTYTHSHSLRLEHVNTPLHLMCTSLGPGRKLKASEKTDKDMGRRCKLHFSSQESFSLFLIIVITKGRWMKQHYWEPAYWENQNSLFMNIQPKAILL